MITQIDPQVVAAAQRSVAFARPSDTSSDGRYEVHPEGDRVVLTDSMSGQQRALPVQNLRIDEATVSDDGQTVVLRGAPLPIVEKAGVKERVCLLGADGALTVLDEGVTTRSVDISPDGREVAVSSCFDLKVVDTSGHSRNLAKLPVFIDEVEYVPGDQILARGVSNSWGGPSVSAWYLVDAHSGQWRFISDLGDAERLSPAIRQSLAGQYDAAYPYSLPTQRRNLVDLFGYQLPAYRLTGPNARATVFEMKGMSQDPAQGQRGVYFIDNRNAQALPVLLTDSSRGGDVGGRSLSAVSWSQNKHAAVLFRGGAAGEAARLTIAVDGGKRVDPLPLEVDGKRVVWSPDERHVAFDVVARDVHHAYVYDVDKQSFYPVAAGASVERWNGGRVVVSSAAGEKEVFPVPLDPEQATGVILGGKTAPKAPGEIVVEPDEVVIGGVHVPRRTE